MREETRKTQLEGDQDNGKQGGQNMSKGKKKGRRLWGRKWLQYGSGLIKRARGAVGVHINLQLLHSSPHLEGDPGSCRSAQNNPSNRLDQGRKTGSKPRSQV